MYTDTKIMYLNLFLLSLSVISIKDVTSVAYNCTKFNGHGRKIHNLKDNIQATNLHYCPMDTKSKGTEEPVDVRECECGKPSRGNCSIIISGAGFTEAPGELLLSSKSREKDDDYELCKMGTSSTPPLSTTVTVVLSTTTAHTNTGVENATSGRPSDTDTDPGAESTTPGQFGVTQPMSGAPALTTETVIAAVVVSSVLVLAVITVAISCIRRRHQKYGSKGTDQEACCESAYQIDQSPINRIQPLENPLYNRQSTQSLKSHPYEEIGGAGGITDNSVNSAGGGYEEIPGDSIQPIVVDQVDGAPVDRQLSVRSGAYEEIKDDPGQPQIPPIPEEPTNYDTVDRSGQDYVIASDDYAVTFTENEIYDT